MSFLAGVAAAAGGPAENDFKALFAKHWQISREFTLTVAKAMPAENYDFKPNPEEMSFGELMDVHRDLQLGSLRECGRNRSAGSTRSCRHDARAVHKMFDIGEGRQPTGTEVLAWACTDTAHHRGQAEVYLRVKNIKPPRYVFWCGGSFGQERSSMPCGQMRDHRSSD